MHNNLAVRITILAKSSAFRLALGTLLSALALYLAVRDIRPETMLKAFAGVSPALVALGLLSVCLNTLAKVARWRTLLGARARGTSFLQLLRALLAGQLINALLPVRLGDLSRAYAIGGQGPGRAYTLGSVALEKVVDLICMAMLIVVLLVSLPLPVWLTRTAAVTSVLTVALTACLIVIGHRGTRFTSMTDALLSRLPARYSDRLRHTAHSVWLSVDVLRSPTVIFMLAGWSLMVWLTAIATNELLLLAFGIRLPVSAAYLLLVVLLAGVSLPNVLGGLGLFEYLCVLSLGLFGVEQSLALSFGIVLHVVTLIPMLLVGPVNLLNLRHTGHVSRETN